MKRILTSFGLAVGLVLGLAGVAQAHTGSVTATQSCTEVTVTATLDSNVSADRTYTVTSTIPGITGSSGSGPGTGAVVYTQTIPSDGTLAGSATLTIFGNEDQEFSTTAYIEPVGDCPTPPPPPCEQTEAGCPTPPPPPPTCDNTPSLCPTPTPPPPTCDTDPSLCPTPTPTPTPTPVPSPTPPPVKDCKPQNFPCWHPSHQPSKPGPGSGGPSTAFTGLPPNAGPIAAAGIALLFVAALALRLGRRRYS